MTPGSEQAFRTWTWKDAPPTMSRPARNRWAQDANARDSVARGCIIIDREHAGAICDVLRVLAVEGGFSGEMEDDLWGAVRLLDEALGDDGDG